MKTLTGHLTATEKKVIKEILRLGLMEGRVKSKNYFISKINGIFTVKVQQKDRGMIPVAGSKLRLSTYTSTFTF